MSTRDPADLTAQQAKILELIRTELDASGMPPTRAEIAQRMGFSTRSSADEHLRALAKKGFLDLVPGAARGVRLRGEHPRNLLARAVNPRDLAGLPLIGKVAAGSPVLSEAHIHSRHYIDPLLFKPRADYLLRVRGLSMQNTGILDGDLLAVHASSEARSGQIVVARLNGEVTVKRLQRRGNKIQLLAENADFAPIHVDTDDFAIEGIAVGLIRSSRAW